MYHLVLQLAFQPVYYLVLQFAFQPNYHLVLQFVLQPVYHLDLHFVFQPVYHLYVSLCEFVRSVCETSCDEAKEPKLKHLLTPPPSPLHPLYNG